ncbi:macrophage mannose receptor 1-like [Cyprinus carpio]|uniref:Macrophage mannose receptor 1-like n=1 Tax=Cyprinus carpio TaxID=7962 RepID=A0A9R0A461_CYPCA|nr:macrophage mannose receptor 1-like [Cyprinus carpio]
MDLATVQNDEDRAKLKEAANTVNFQSVAWIGFYRVIWRWSYQNTPISYEMWLPGDPDMPDADEACVVQTSGEWGDRDCTDQYGFFCQTDTQDTLQNKFIYIDIVMNWIDAQIYCRTHYVDLATITDDTENTFLANILSDVGLSDAWIGLHKNLWLWSDNSSVSLSSVKWESGQPDNVNGNEDCVKASTEGLMADDSCSTPLPFYCREHRKIQRVRFTVKSDGDLDESAVMEAIEKKIKEILSDQDMKFRSSIKWSIQPDGKIFQQQKTQENTHKRRHVRSYIQ